MPAKILPVIPGVKTNGLKFNVDKQDTSSKMNTKEDITNKMNSNKTKSFCLICGRLQRRKCISFFVGEKLK